MGNMICLYDDRVDDETYVKMSNSLTSLFLAVLALSGSAQAVTDREKELVIWLAEHDQSVRGIGTVGFHLSEIPWTQEGFAAEREFCLRMVDGAAARTNWDRLPYSPGEELLQHRLTEFRRLLDLFEANQVREATYLAWREWAAEGVPPGFPTCPQHGVLLTCYGCIICKDK